MATKGIAFTEETIQKLFGHEAAEDEEFDRLKEYYFKHTVFSRITADLRLRILVAHKGIGKSALFTIARSEDRDEGRLSILVKPDDVAGIAADEADFLMQIRAWKEGLGEIVSRKVFDEFGVEEDTKGRKLIGQGGRFISYLAESITKVGENINIGPGRQKIVERFLMDRKVIVYIDDLDRGWLSRREDIVRISALLNAARDLANENTGLYFRIALRSDVYFLVRTSDESTDKIEGNVVWFNWTNHEILVMLIKRVQTFLGNEVDDQQLLGRAQPQIAYLLDPVIANRYTGVGKWENIPTYRMLMSLIRQRPRDLVKLCTLAARQAYDDDARLISTVHFDSVFEEYSQGRIQDTINEHKSELPDIERLIFGMKPNKRERRTELGYVYATDQLVNKIGTIIERGRFNFANGRQGTPKALAQFLYKVNFLTARKVLESGEIQRKYFEESRYLSSDFVDFGYDWEVHPAYRWALQPDDLDSIFKEMAPSADSR
jgi:hypothetical protein